MHISNMKMKMGIKLPKWSLFLYKFEYYLSVNKIKKYFSTHRKCGMTGHPIMEMFHILYLT